MINPSSVAEDVRRLYGSDVTPVDIETFLPPDLGKWPLSRPMARWLTRLVVGLERTSVLEFGAGWSSLVLARALAARGGGRLTSVEHQPAYVADAWGRAEAVAGVDASLVVTDLHRRVSPDGLLWSYRGVRRTLAPRAPFDLVFIDAPPGRYGRSSPLHDAYPLLSPGAIVVLDDAARDEEQVVIKRWLATYPGLHLAIMDTGIDRGVAVFVHDGTTRRRIVPRAIVRTVREELYRIRHQRGTSAPRQA